MPAATTSALAVLSDQVAQTKQVFAETQTLASDWLAQQNLIVDALRQRASESV